MITDEAVRNVLDRLPPERHSKKRHPESAEAAKAKVSPGLAEALVIQSPGLEEGVQISVVDPV